MKCAPIKDILYWYFYKSFKPSIQLWIDKEDQELDGWDALAKRATRVKAKAKIQASISQDIYQYCHQGNRLLHTLAAKTQLTKGPKVEESRAKPQEDLA